MNRSDIIGELKTHDLLIKGSRNDDAVNLAIVAYGDDPSISNSAELVGAMVRLIKSEKLSVDEVASDWGYLENKASVLIDYLPRWYHVGDIYSFAII